MPAVATALPMEEVGRQNARRCRLAKTKKCTARCGDEARLSFATVAENGSFDFDGSRHLHNDKLIRSGAKNKRSDWQCREMAWEPFNAWAIGNYQFGNHSYFLWTKMTAPDAKNCGI
jgi:hypothetical protein